MELISRREVVSILSTVSICSAIGGCLTIDNSARIIGFESVNVTQQNDSVVFHSTISVTISLDRRDDEWGAFHNVEVVGYSDDGEEICRRDLGTITEDRDGETFELKCPDHPAVVQYEAQESPCDDDTIIRKRVREEFEGDIVYSQSSRKCGETP